MINSKRNLHIGRGVQPWNLKQNVTFALKCPYLGYIYQNISFFYCLNYI